MGSSGAGKTTLMDVIAGRKTGGQIQVDILLNGHPATELAIRRATGYCEQLDIHSCASTFREALTFSAFLRQDADVDASQKYESVNECLDLLDLNPIADQIIRGSSTEQMKRLTFGVELAAQPSVLFLDEPTSGLDARSAKLIMDGVRNVSNTGRTVERAAFYRERAAQTYNVVWYVTGGILVEIPYCAFTTLLFVAIFYPMVGFTGVSDFFSFWFCLSLLVLQQGYMGQFLVFDLPSVEVAAVFAQFINTISILFTGMNPPVNSLPSGYVWLYRINPNTYTFAILTAIVFAAREDGSGPGCERMSGTPPTLADNMTVAEYMGRVVLDQASGPTADTSLHGSVRFGFYLFKHFATSITKRDSISS